MQRRPYTFDLAPSFAAAASRYQLAVTVMQYAELLRHSPWAQGSSLASLSFYTGQVAASLPADADVAEFANLVTRSTQLSGQ